MIIDFLSKLDRRWIFLTMFLAVAIPVLMQPTLPEKPTPIVRAVFNEIEELPSGSRVLFSFDYDPASKPELGPMNTALVRHAALRGHRLYFMTLWPFGPPMVQDAVTVVEREFGHVYEYGVHYIDFGFRAGDEAVIKLAATDLPKTFPVDARGRPFASYEINSGVQSLQNMDLVVSVGAGFPGTKEWVQYLSTPFPEVRLVAAVTGVSAPPQYPYYPAQLKGMLPAIKGAAEYEAALGEAYGTAGVHLAALVTSLIEQRVTDDQRPLDVIEAVAAAAEIPSATIARIADGRINCLPLAHYDSLARALGVDSESLMAAAVDDGCDYSDGRDYPPNWPNYQHPAHQEALGRMGPQLSAHILMLVLIVLGNIIFFIERRRNRR